MFIIDDLFLWWPFKGIRVIASEVGKLAEKEQDEFFSLKKEMEENQLFFDSGKITREDFEKRETRLTQRWKKITKRRRKY